MMLVAFSWGTGCCTVGEGGECMCVRGEKLSGGAIYCGVGTRLVFNI